MKEYTSPGAVQIAEDDNLTRSLFDNARAFPNRPALARKVGGAFVDMSSKAFADEVVAIAKGFIAAGIEPGSMIAIYSSTRIEWTLLDYAIWAAGCVTVPIYETSSAEQVEWIIGDSGAVGIFCETSALKATFDEVKGSLGHCEHVHVIDDGGLETVKAAGKDLDDSEVHQRAEALDTSSIATLVYTSGTTGRPKGCTLTHGNFIFDSAQVEQEMSEFFKPGMSTLLFLPLAHIFARVIQIGCVRAGVRLAFSEGIPVLTEELGVLKPDFLLAVPRVFEKVFVKAQQKAHGDGKGKIFDLAAETAIAYSRESAAGGVSLATKIKHAVFDKLVYSKLRAVLGGKIEFAVSGGAALGERLGHFFNGIGVLILEGYGLTETTAGAVLNSPSQFKIGTVGKPLPGVSVRIADDGEILLKGGNVFQGYYNNPEATAEAIAKDGWFHTGDIGELDAEGYLRITGRKKEIIVTAGGKNVAPAVLEDRMRAHRLVSQSVVIGDGQAFIAALITIDPEEFPAWAEEHGKAGKSVADLADDETLRAEIEKAIKDANNAVSKAEAVKAFRILPQDFEVGDELSQKMSVKRHVVATKYASVIDDIYGDKKSSTGIGN